MECFNRFLLDSFLSEGPASKPAPPHQSEQAPCQPLWRRYEKCVFHKLKAEDILFLKEGQPGHQDFKKETKAEE
jgi:hypothetical protein